MIDHSLLPSIRNATLPERYQAAKVAVAECNRIDECKDWADKTAALASYARQSEDEDLEKMAMRIRARAIRRCGELYGEVEKALGGRPKTGTAAGTSFRKEVREQVGLSKRQADTALQVARVNGESFEQQVESDNPPTITALADQGRKKTERKPIYEELGISKEQFQAALSFRADLKDYAEQVVKYEPDLVVAGIKTAEHRQAILRNLKIVAKHHEKIKCKLLKQKGS